MYYKVGRDRKKGQLPFPAAIYGTTNMSLGGPSLGVYHAFQGCLRVVLSGFIVLVAGLMVHKVLSPR